MQSDTINFFYKKDMKIKFSQPNAVQFWAYAMGEFTASSLVDIGRVGWWGDKVSLFV